MGGAKDVTVADYLPSFEVVEEPELIDDDPELSAERAEALRIKFIGIVKEATGIEPDGGSRKADSTADV